MTRLSDKVRFPEAQPYKQMDAFSNLDAVTRVLWPFATDNNDLARQLPSKCQPRSLLEYFSFNPELKRSKFGGAVGHYEYLLNMLHAFLNFVLMHWWIILDGGRMSTLTKKTAFGPQSPSLSQDIGELEYIHEGRSERHRGGLGRNSVCL
jgi:hypothetical protein